MTRNAETRVGILRTLQRFRTSSIGVQFTLIVVLSVVATTAAVAVSATASARRFALSEARRRVDLAVEVESSRLRDVLVEKDRTVSSWGRLEVMRALTYGDVDKQIAEFLGRSLAGSPENVAAACTDRTGAVVASVGPTDVVEALAAPARQQAAVLAVRGRRLLRFSAPAVLADAPGPSPGQVLLAVDPAVLLASRSARHASTYTLELRDPSGLAVASTGAGSPGPDAIVAEAALAPVGAATAAGLRLAATEPAEVALAPARVLQRRIAMAGASVLAVASLLGAFVALRISRPLRLFASAVERIRERGRLSGPLDLPSGPREVDVLAGSFARMARTLSLAEERNLAQSRLALLGEVAANIAHEVRTPLSSLRSAGQMLASDDRDEQERRRLGNLIVSEADRLHRVVSDLVQTARPVSGLRRRLGVRSAIDRAVATLEPLLAESESRIDVIPGDREVFVEADPDLLQQALLNVLRNGLDAAGPRSTLLVRVRRAGTTVDLEVEDPGPGFADEVLAQPFKPFQTTKAGGTGLGLAIVRRIFEEHGGTVSLANAASGGAIVTLSLPEAAA